MSETASGHVRQVVLVAKTGPEAGRRLARDIGEWLDRRGVRVIWEAETASAVGRDDGVPRQELPAGIDLAIVAGGDGTLLSVARTAAPLGIPILGINLGSLGFLTELQPDEVFEGLSRVLEGRFTIEERHTLRVLPRRPGQPPVEYALLNDAVIAKSALARMISIEVRVDGTRVANYTADGLIVATPTGSTAYNLSAGGPILDPRMSAFVIAPICPHSMTYRPVVVPGSVTIEVYLRSDGEAVYLTLDGQVGYPLDAEDSLAIDRHPSPVRLVRITDRSFFEVLRRKLRWGERSA